MKKILATALLAFSTVASANNVIANGTRFIYPSNEKEITVQLTNNASRPALVQSWLDNGDPTASPDDISAPFTITPPVAKIGSKQGQTLRIRNIDKSGLATDRETLWWLNVLEIPPSVSGGEQKDKNILLMAIRSRFKFVYRPVGLGDVNKAPSALEFKGGSNKVTITNPTPFYITVTKIAKKDKVALNKATAMLEPKSTATVALSSGLNAGDKVSITTLNDFGSDAEYTLTVK